MATRVERTPFTVYDMLGYFIPGLYLTIYVTLFFSGDLIAGLFKNSHVPMSTIKQALELSTNEATKKMELFNIADKLLSPSSTAYFTMLVIVLIESYVVGHVLSYLSSVTIERMCVGFFGQPSEALSLDRNDEVAMSQYCKIVFRKFLNRHRIIHSLLLFALLPHSLTLLLFSKTTLRRLTVRPPGKAIEKRIRSNFQTLFSIETHQISTEEMFRMIDYYNHANDERLSARKYNYVTLYGFCRSMCLAVYAVLLLDLAYVFGYLSNAFYDISEVRYDILINLTLTILLMLAYFKYFRRYSQDSLRAFAAIPPYQLEKNVD